MSTQQQLVIAAINRHITDGARLQSSLKLVATKFGMSLNTVKTWWYALKHRPQPTHGNCVLSPIEFKITEAMFCALSNTNIGLSSSEARSAVQNILGKAIDRSTWWRYLNNKEYGFCLRIAKPLSKKRMSISKVEEIEAWIQRVKEQQQIYSFNRHTVMNFDETTFEYSPGKCYVVTKRGTEQNNVAHTKNMTRCSAMVFARANGQNFFSVLITQKRSDEADGFFDPAQAGLDFPYVPMTYDIRFYRNESGKIAQIDFHAILEAFADFWNSMHPGLVLWLFADQASCHVNPFTTVELYKKKIHLNFFPSDTSHFLQPMDNAPFAQLKDGFRTLFQEGGRSLTFRGGQANRWWNTTAIKALDLYLPKTAIIAGFRNTGIFPFDGKKILERATNPSLPKAPLSDVVTQHLSEAFSTTVQTIIDKTPSLQRKRSSKIRDRQEWLASDRTDILFADDGALSPPKKKAKRMPRKIMEEQGLFLKSICPVEDCKKRHYGGKNWYKCQACSQDFCPRHSENFREHAQTCGNQ